MCLFFFFLVRHITSRIENRITNICPAFKKWTQPSAKSDSHLTADVTLFQLILVLLCSFSVEMRTRWNNIRRVNYQCLCYKSQAFNIGHRCHAVLTGTSLCNINVEIECQVKHWMKDSWPVSGVCAPNKQSMKIEIGTCRVVSTETKMKVCWTNHVLDVFSVLVVIVCTKAILWTIRPNQQTSLIHFLYLFFCIVKATIWHDNQNCMSTKNQEKTISVRLIQS